MNEAVRRVLARDSLLMMAIDADEAVGIVGQREMLAKLVRDEDTLFEVALRHHLEATAPDRQWSEQARAWRCAGIIVRFSDMVGIPARKPAGWAEHTATDMHEQSLRVLIAEDEARPMDLNQHTIHRFLAARDLRLDGRLREAIELSRVRPQEVYAGGAEGYLGYLLFEAAAAHLELGQGDRVADVLSGADEHWRSRAAASTGRYRTDFVRALAHWGSPAANADLVTAFTRVQRRTALDGPGRDLEELSVTLTRAEHLAEYPAADRDRAKTVLLARRALQLADRVQGRWRVVARSRAPLAVVFQRIYGDIARLAAGCAQEGAAELGLRVVLSAKQTGFAARMRADRRLLNPDVEDIIENIVLVEDGPPGGVLGTEPDPDELDRLRFQLAEAVSPMLADTVLPVPAELDRLFDRIGDRFALDYVELADSRGVPRLFRCLIRPDRRITFERCRPSRSSVDYFAEVRRTGRLTRDFVTAGKDEVDTGFDWLRLARELLPADLLVELAAADPDHPLELVISTHSWLSLVPWPALEIAAAGTRLIERAVVTQTPVFTCLQHRQPPPVTGEALVRLVGRTGETAGAGVNVERERLAWGLGPGMAGVPVSSCAIAGPGPLRPLGGKLAEALRGRQRWGFAHLASHGNGEGLAQYLRIPGETLSFGLALTLDWPESVLMASCHVGRVVNVTGAEPLSLVMALLSGGARCVVAGLSSIDDDGTGKVAEHIVRAIRSDTPVSLAVALRDAQRAAVEAGEPVRNWALLGAYVQ
jgi:hypothetical protein